MRKRIDSKKEWIEERAAIILEGNSFPLGMGRWTFGISEKRAFQMAEREYEEFIKTSEEQQDHDKT